MRGVRAKEIRRATAGWGATSYHGARVSLVTKEVPTGAILPNGAPEVRVQQFGVTMPIRLAECQKLAAKLGKRAHVLGISR